MTKQSANRVAKAGAANRADAWAVATVAAWGAANLPAASYEQLPEGVLAALRNDGRLALAQLALRAGWRWRGWRSSARERIAQWR